MRAISSAEVLHSFFSQLKAQIDREEGANQVSASFPQQNFFSTSAAESAGQNRENRNLLLHSNEFARGSVDRHRQLGPFAAGAINDVPD